MRLLFLFLLAAAPLVAHDAPPREPFPSDYVSSPCAPTADQMCGGVKKVDFANLAFRFRGVTIDHAWIDAHWEEMKNDAFGPLCNKMANCYTVPGADTAWCQDLLRKDFPATCERFPAGSEDRDQCVMFATSYFVMLGVRTELLKKAQECTARSAGPGLRRLDAWVSPEVIGLDNDAPITVHVLDAERRVPVRARIAIDGGGALKATDGPHPTAAIPSTWQRKLKRVPNSEGREDLVAPKLTITAEGYEPLQLTLPVRRHELSISMKPAARELRRGRNLVTISAHETATGKPVEMRVMSGHTVLGNTNIPFELTVGRKRPEIWLTSLFDHYDDVVIVRAE